MYWTLQVIWQLLNTKLEHMPHLSIMMGKLKLLTQPSWLRQDSGRHFWTPEWQGSSSTCSLIKGHVSICNWEWRVTREHFPILWMPEIGYWLNNETKCNPCKKEVLLMRWNTNETEMLTTLTTAVSFNSTYFWNLDLDLAIITHIFKLLDWNKGVVQKQWKH